MVRPSGDHCGLPAPRGMSVMARASPPAIASTWICGGCGRPSFSTARTKAIHRPSGDHRGPVSRVPTVSRRGASRAVGARDPEAGVVLILFLVHGDPDEGHLGAVGGDLRVGHPDELEQVLLGDVPLLGESRGGSEREQGNAGG